MVAGIFAKHGYWVGTSFKDKRRYNETGYYENNKVKEFMKRWYDIRSLAKSANSGEIFHHTKGFSEAAEKVILEDGYPDDGTPWLLKFGANFFWPWYITYPEATVVGVYRSPKAIIESGRHSFRVTPERIDSHLNVMRNVPGLFPVYYDKIVDRNWGELKPVFEKENVEMNEKLIDDFVNPSLRHFK